MQLQAAGQVLLPASKIRYLIDDTKFQTGHSQLLIDLLLSMWNSSGILIDIPNMEYDSIHATKMIVDYLE